MVRGGKVSSKLNFRKRARSKEGGSDESDEDYVVSEEDRYVSDCPDDYSSSLDGCASEESFDGDGFIEDEEEEEKIQPVRKFNRSKAKNGVCGWRKNASKTSRKRGRITNVKQEEQERDAAREEEEDEDEEKDKDKDEDFNYDDNDDGDDDDGDEEFTPEEEDYSDDEEDFDYDDGGGGDDDDDDDDEEFTPKEEDYTDDEEGTRVRKKTKNGMKMGKKVLKRRVSVTSTRRRKRRSSRASKKPLRKKRRKNGGLKRKVRSKDADDFIDNCPAIRKKRTKKLGQENSRLLIKESNSDCVSSDYEFTISEEEREQVREAKELCPSLRRNLRSSSLLVKDEESGVHEDLHQQRRLPGRKGKEKIEEPQGKKGKEKVEELKSEVGKQSCGICLSEETKRRLRGVLDCCTHYFCFSCIMEWAKVESRCPLCKQRFKSISKPARSSAGIDLREVVVQVPERDQVYQPSEEELRSYIDPYEYVICSECHQGGDDALMLLCDICDSPAHTYCVGLGREVPEGNWYCDGCRPVALGSSSSQVQERVDDPRATTQSLPVRPSAVLNVPESIDLNLMSSPRTSFSQGYGHISSSRFSGRSVEAASPVSGGGAPTLSERRWIHRQIQQILSMDRMTSTPGRTNGISATNSTSNLHSSQIDQSRETNATLHARTQDVGTSYYPFLEERLCNNNSPSIQTGDPSSMRTSNARRPVVQDSIMVSSSPMNGVLWPGLVGTPSIPDNLPVHQFSSRSNIVTDVSLPPAIREQSNFQIVKEQLQSMVKGHLKSLSRDIDLGHSTFKEIARSSTHTILAACGLEHNMSEVCLVTPSPVCPHIELMAGGQTSPIKGCCSYCFDSFVRDVVKGILDTKMSSQWLRLGL